MFLFSFYVRSTILFLDNYVSLIMFVNLAYLTHYIFRRRCNKHKILLSYFLKALNTHTMNYVKKERTKKIVEQLRVSLPHHYSKVGVLGGWGGLWYDLFYIVQPSVHVQNK